MEGISLLHLVARVVCAIYEPPGLRCRVANKQCVRSSPLGYCSGDDDYTYYLSFIVIVSFVIDFLFQMIETSTELSITSDVTGQLYHTICMLPSLNPYQRPFLCKISTFIERTSSYISFCICPYNDPKLKKWSKRIKNANKNKLKMYIKNNYFFPNIKKKTY